MRPFALALVLVAAACAAPEPPGTTSSRSASGGTVVCEPPARTVTPAGDVASSIVCMRTDPAPAS